MTEMLQFSLVLAGQHACDRMLETEESLKFRQ